MIIKKLEFNDEARAKLISGIKKISDAVKSTLGGGGRTVLIESPNHIGGFVVTGDGVSVGREIFLEDATENLAVRMVLQASEKSNSTNSDGTSTAVLLTYAIVNEAYTKIQERMNVSEVTRAMRKCADEIIVQLRKSSRKVNINQLKYVARVACRGDIESGDMIASAYEKIGGNGIVLSERSVTDKTYSDVIKGMRIARGWANKAFVTDNVRGECIMENPYILLAGKKILTIQSIEHLLVPAISSGRPILIIAEIDDKPMMALCQNKLRGNISVCAIMPPDNMIRRDMLMEDIASATGGRYWGENDGDIENMPITDLGTCDKVVVSIDKTVLLASDTFDVSSRKEEIEEAMKLDENVGNLQFFKERLSNLNGGIGIVYVGAVSEVEMKERKDRIDDAVGAVSAALEEGILAGGGVALMDISQTMDWGKNEVERVAWHILKSAIQYPYKQILENAGYVAMTEDNGSSVQYKKNFGTDVISGKTGDMFKLGIIDPCKVTVSALTNAVSVATTIMSTNCIITNMREGDNKN